MTRLDEIRKRDRRVPLKTRLRRWFRRMFHACPSCGRVLPVVDQTGYRWCSRCNRRFDINC